MKRFLLFAALLWAVTAHGQAPPIQRNSITTNILGTNLLWQPLSVLFTVNGIGPAIVLHNTAGGVNQKRFYLTSVGNYLELNWSSDDSLSSRILGSFDTNGNFIVNGYLGISGATNQVSSSGGVVLLDGNPIATGGSTTNPSLKTVTFLATGNVTFGANAFPSAVWIDTGSGAGLGGWTTNLPVSDLAGGVGATASTFWRGDGRWATPGSGTTVSVNATNVTTPNIQDTATITWAVSGSNLTATAVSGGGASAWVPVTTLAFSTTNVTIPLNGGTNFVVTLTNGATGYFTSSGAPAAATTNATWTLTTIQDATGVRAMNWDTSVFHFQGGVVPVITTNASAEDVFTLSTSAKTAGKINVTWNPDFR